MSPSSRKEGRGGRAACLIDTRRIVCIKAGGRRGAVPTAATQTDVYYPSAVDTRRLRYPLQLDDPKLSALGYISQTDAYAA